MKPKDLAIAIYKKICKEGNQTYSDLEARAVKRGLSLDLLDQALEIVHKSSKITVTGTTYKLRVAKIEPTGVIRDYHYPVMIEGVNDASHPIFERFNIDHLFLTPDEMKEYKIQLKGGYGGNYKRYAKKT